MTISPIVIFIITAAAVIGYRFISVCNYTKFSINLVSRPVIIYDSMYCGGMIFFVLYTLYLIPNNYVIFPSLGLYAIGPKYIIVYVSAIFASYLPHLLNFFIFKDETKYLKIEMENQSDSLFLTILNSIEEGYLVELTLKNGEIFVGFLPKSLTFRYKYVDLIPYASGICGNDTRITKITRKYWILYSELAGPSTNPIEYSTHRISIMAEEILTARRFDPRIYSFFEEDSLATRGAVHISW